MRLHRVILAVAVALGLAACAEPAPNESATEQALLGSILASPSSLTFGERQVNAPASPVQLVNVNPTGLTPFYTSITVSDCQGFDIVVTRPDVGQECTTCPLDVAGQPLQEQCPIQLTAPYSTCFPTASAQFSVAFHPTVAQTYNCTIYVQADSTTRQVTVSGTGTPPPQAISVTPTSVAFGDVRVGTTSTAATVTARNAGGQNLEISSVTASAGFAVSGGAATLAPNGSKAYSVTCTPGAATTLSGQLTIVHNAPNSPTKIPVSCRGVQSALEISPSPLTVTTRVGESVERTIQLTNTGGASMTLESVTLTGDGFAPTTMPGAGTVLAANGGTAAAIVMVEAATAGDATATLSVNYDGGQSRTATITATSNATSMALSPDGAFDFGPVCVGQSRLQHVTIKAAEAGGFRVDSLSQPAEPFTLSPLELPATVQGSGGSELAFDVTVAPLDIGAATSAIDITSDIPGATARSLALSVTGLPAGVSATPTELDLGPSELDKPTLGGAVELMNCADVPVTLSNPRIEGDHPDDFSIVEVPDLELGANAQARWLVIATPRDAGTRTAKFSVDYPGGTASVDLYANGVTDVPPTGGDDLGGVDTSYYACSTGSASGAWPLLLALVPILRRRKRRAHR